MLNKELYGVFFDPNGGTGNMDNIVAEKGTTITIPNNSFTNKNLNFVGWSIDGTDTVVYQSGDTVLLNNSFMLTAVWKLEVTISFVSNSNENIDNIKLFAGQTISNIPSISKTGYEFIGWYTENGGKGVKYENGCLAPNGNLVLYAYWEVIIYSITYNLNDSNIVNPNTITTYTIESNDIYLEHATQNNKLFDGWYNNNNELVSVIKSGSTGNIVLTPRMLSYPSEIYSYLIKHGDSIDTDSLINSIKSEYGYKELKLSFNNTEDYSLTGVYEIQIDMTSNVGITEYNYPIGILVVGTPSNSYYDSIINSSINGLSIELLVPYGNGTELYSYINYYYNPSYFSTKVDNVNVTNTVDSLLTKRSFGVFDSGTQSWSYRNDLLGSLLPGLATQTNGSILQESTLWDNNEASNSYNITFINSNNSNIFMEVILTIKQSKTAIDAKKLLLFNEKKAIQDGQSTLNGDLSYNVVDSKTNNTSYHLIDVTIKNTKNANPLAVLWDGDPGGWIAMRIGGAGLKTMMVGQSRSMAENVKSSQNINNVQSSTASSLYVDIDGGGIKKVGYYSSNNTGTLDLVDVYEALSSSIDGLGLGLGYTSAWKDLDKKGGFMIYQCIDHDTGIVFTSDIYYIYFHK